MGQTHARLRRTRLTQPDKTAIRDAATIVVQRQIDGRRHVLMGQRGKSAAFMPDKFVFPGGAVDAVDATIPLASPVPPRCAARLAQNCVLDHPEMLVAAAIRELWEETGQILGQPGDWPTPAPQGWRGFAKAGYRPSADGISFVFRAITPPGRPRRFDARFFLADADRLMTDPDDFTRAEDELSHLQWVPVAEARQFNLPFITEVVLAELAGLPDGPLDSVPFFDNSGDQSVFRRLA
ncbi:NUDIX hydrolase [Actibacterium ureilyticum]|uniref:NUDIX hydrolase n=1 Tax=Actibacterium ureilyticum TaxID=1590614 RepID=UPI000BAAB9DB|nr:NUDIX hydrolase [Actibacterium ureilyticum]